MTVQDEPRRGRRPPAFTIPDSPASSRASSPAPDLKLDEKYEGNGYDSAPGQHSSDVYDVTLPKWRAAIRRKIVERVQVESKVVAKIQVRHEAPCNGAVKLKYYPGHGSTTMA